MRGAKESATKCAECEKPVKARTHWLCCAHRRARGRAFIARNGQDSTEGAVLGELVFSFPAACASVEHFLGHFYAVTRCWTIRAPWRDVLKQHFLLGKVRVCGSMSRAEVTELVTRFTVFTVGHARAYGWTQLVATCAARVEEWYPALVPEGPLDSVLGAERMLACLPARHRPCFVFSDVERALRALPRDAVECVFLHYIRLIRHPAERPGGFRFTCEPPAMAPKRRPKRARPGAA
jgi:hypothetical protein